MISVTVLRGARDRHGDRVTPAEHVIQNCIPAPRTASGTRATSEDNDRGETVIVGLTLYAPFDADLRATDQVRIDAAAWAGTYDVVGEPGRWASPFTEWQPGMEVALTRTS